MAVKVLSKRCFLVILLLCSTYSSPWGLQKHTNPRVSQYYIWQKLPQVPSCDCPVGPCFFSGNLSRDTVVQQWSISKATANEPQCLSYIIAAIAPIEVECSPLVCACSTFCSIRPTARSWWLSSVGEANYHFWK